MVVTHPEAVLVKTASYFRTSKPRMWFLAQRRSRANNNWSCDSSGLTLDNVYTFFEVEVTSEQGTLTSSPLAKKQINATNVAITIRIDNSMMFSLRTNTMHVNWQDSVCQLTNERRKTVTGNMCSYPMLFLCSVETYSCTTVDFLKSSAEMTSMREALVGSFDLEA